MEDNKDIKTDENQDNKLSYEVLHKENEELRKEIQGLKDTIKDMKEVIKCNLGVSDNETKKESTTGERHDKLQKLVEEVFR